MCNGFVLSSVLCQCYHISVSNILNSVTKCYDINITHYTIWGVSETDSVVLPALYKKKCPRLVLMGSNSKGLDHNFTLNTYMLRLSFTEVPNVTTECCGSKFLITNVPCLKPTLFLLSILRKNIVNKMEHLQWSLTLLAIKNKLVLGTSGASSVYCQKPPTSGLLDHQQIMQKLCVFVFVNIHLRSGTIASNYVVCRKSFTFEARHWKTTLLFFF